MKTRREAIWNSKDSLSDDDNHRNFGRVISLEQLARTIIFEGGGRRHVNRVHWDGYDSYVSETSGAKNGGV
jgi:hypothetical protein